MTNKYKSVPVKSSEITPYSQRCLDELSLPFLLQSETLVQITEEEWESAPDRPYPLPTDRDLSEQSPDKQ